MPSTARNRERNLNGGSTVVFEYGTCHACGRKIVWAMTGDGKSIPLDPSAPVYRYVHGTRKDGEMGGKCQRAGDFCEAKGMYAEGFFVSHFATCTKVDRVRGGPPRSAPD